MNGRKKKLPVFLTFEEQKRILDQISLRYPTGKRNYTVILLMLDTGLRLNELTGLKWDNVDLMSGDLYVIEGKGAKDRNLWISSEVLDMLRVWKKEQANQLRKRDITERAKYVFTTLEGNKINNSYIRNMVYRYRDKSGINKKVSPHTFRHTFATELYRNSKDIRKVQKALGHSDLSTTMIYTHIVDDELKESMKSIQRNRRKKFKELTKK